ncbi:MAG TPA: Glu/Leu/Phe/Val dehydrogenase dimerization domain-containing protein [Blastocatellia bacterium]|nr:Glu/Leu/Phe/Val dehydrogenase dimerization domain-containing protein [Blastocatellia bacterium]
MLGVTQPCRKRSSQSSKSRPLTAGTHYIEIADADDLARPTAAGWISDAEGVRRNPPGMFPPVLESTEFVLWLRVESIDVFVGRVHQCLSVVAGRTHLKTAITGKGLTASCANSTRARIWRSRLLNDKKAFLPTYLNSKLAPSMTHQNMNTPAVETIEVEDYEKVVTWHEPDMDYRGIIALHSTKLGPAVGGTRFWPYHSFDEALADVLRLSRGMTYKNAAAGLPFGGGKAVIIGDGRTIDRTAWFRAHGRFVESLQGRFITGEDVGTSPEDMQAAAQETRFVAGFAGRGGDPSPWTARGVLRGIQASARQRWGGDDLRGKTVALQGCGNVGFALAQLLKEAGARLIVTDVDAARAAACARACDAVTVAPEEIYDAAADVFAPCALGGILNEQTIPRLQAAIIAGAANNQLNTEADAEVIEARDILYAPDFILNAGGIISGGAYLLGESPSQLEQRIAGIYDTLLAVYDLAAQEKITTAAAAEAFAEQRLRAAQ